MDVQWVKNTDTLAGYVQFDSKFYQDPEYM